MREGQGCHKGRCRFCCFWGKGNRQQPNDHFLLIKIFPVTRGRFKSQHSFIQLSNFMTTFCHSLKAFNQFNERMKLLKNKLLYWNNFRFIEKVWREQRAPVFPSLKLSSCNLSHTVVHLWKLRDDYSYVTLNWTPEFIWISPVFLLIPFYCFRIPRCIYVRCLHNLLWSSQVDILKKWWSGILIGSLSLWIFLMFSSCIE